MQNITVRYGEGHADTGEISIHQITQNLYSETYLEIECKLRPVILLRNQSLLKNRIEFQASQDFVVIIA